MKLVFSSIFLFSSLSEASSESSPEIVDLVDLKTPNIDLLFISDNDIPTTTTTTTSSTTTTTTEATRGPTIIPIIIRRPTTTRTTTRTPTTTEMKTLSSKRPRNIPSVTRKPIPSRKPTVTATTSYSRPSQQDLDSVCDDIKDPRRFLRPHPTDCSKYVSCAWQGGDRYRPFEMLCAGGTKFDQGLMICNFRCSVQK